MLDTLLKDNLMDYKTVNKELRKVIGVNPVQKERNKTGVNQKTIDEFFVDEQIDVNFHRNYSIDPQFDFINDIRKNFEFVQEPIKGLPESRD